jgi:hypothetical protein
MLKTNGPPFRMGQARRRSRNFVVLTYWQYAPRVNNGRALRDVASNTAALLDDFFDHSRRLPALKSSRAHTGFFARNIQQAPIQSTFNEHNFPKAGSHLP